MKKIILLTASLGLLLIVFMAFANINTPSFNARVVQIFEDGFVVVEPLQDRAISNFGARASFNMNEINDIGVSVGDIVSIRVGRAVLQTYPTIIDARNWSVVERYE